LQATVGSLESAVEQLPFQPLESLLDWGLTGF